MKKIPALFIGGLVLCAGFCRAQENMNAPAATAEELFRAVKKARKDPAGALEQARMLIEQGAPVNVFDRYGVSPLGYAADIGDLELTKLLWAKGASHDCGTERPLIIAAGRGRLDIVKFYIEQGVPADTRSAQGKTALQAAVRSNRTDVVEYLESVNAHSVEGFHQGAGS